MTKNKTGFYTHPSFRLHEMGAGHPECPERLSAIDDRLMLSGLIDQLDRRQAMAGTAEEIERAHSHHHLSAVREMSSALIAELEVGGPSHAHVDPDTMMNMHTLSAAVHAVGAAVAATDAVIAGELSNAFCAVRPPGHHACRDKAMGFCFFNNVAVAARHAVDHHGLQRVAIIDFDVHHGNGTEDIVAGDDRILMVSFYQHPHYPEGSARGGYDNLLNIPVSAYTRGDEIRELVALYWMPRLEAFAPEMIFISAGFDSHREDELGQLGLVEADFAWITHQLVDLAKRHSRGRIVSCLEGGYNRGALARSVEAHVRELILA